MVEQRTVRKSAIWTAALGVLLGVVYGLFARYVFETKPGPGHSVLMGGFAAMSMCFLFLVPFALGVVTAIFTPRESRWRWAYWILMPIVPCLMLMAAVLLLAWEGMFCILLAAPIYFSMAIGGGFFGGLVIWLSERRAPGKASGAAVAFCLLPFALAPLEGRIPTPVALREVSTSVAIDASAETVFRQIVRVPPIAPEELPPSLFRTIGVPRPLEATLTEERVGGVRTARFAEGITFLETVTEWVPPRGYAFSIRVEPGSIRPDVLDRHVRVGGEYFDVLEGRFEIEPREKGVLLRIASRHRLSTRLNFYAGFWSDAIMADIQRSICAVIKKRSEGRPRTSGG
jgi:hypothetical protein